MPGEAAAVTGAGDVHNVCLFLRDTKPRHIAGVQRRGGLHRLEEGYTAVNREEIAMRYLRGEGGGGVWTFYVKIVHTEWLLLLCCVPARGVLRLQVHSMVHSC